MSNSKLEEPGDELVSIIAHGIADAQGDAYAEYASEFDGYAKAALEAIKKHSAGLSIGGVNVWGEPASIKAVLEWQHSHSVIDEIRTNLRHWRDECGKVHAHRCGLTGALKRVGMILEEERSGLSGTAIERLSDAIYPVLIALGDVK